MLKILLFAAFGIASTQAFAGPADMIKGDEKTVQFDTAYCSVVAENYALGELRDRGLQPHQTYADVYAFSPGQIYGVVVKTQVYTDFLIEEGPELNFACYRCPNLKLVVSTKDSKEACKNEQK